MYTLISTNTTKSTCVVSDSLSENTIDVCGDEGTRTQKVGRMYKEGERQGHLYKRSELLYKEKPISDLDRNGGSRNESDDEGAVTVHA